MPQPSRAKGLAAMTMIIKFLPYSPASRPPELSVIGYWARVKPQKGEVGSDLSFSSDLCSPSSVSRPSITSKSTRKSKIKDRFNALTLHRFNVFGRLSHSFVISMSLSGGFALHDEKVHAMEVCILTIGHSPRPGLCQLP